ncbi:4Fe-4S dicluster domain-containing protein [Paludibacterium sp. THUN1379]|nr:4Fe-4S dicluster domain-containing protein [Paludibacterium sp. THUN1379]
MAHPVGEGTEMLSPANFRPRLKVIKSARVSTPVLCRQCDDAPCAKACPSGAIVRREDSIQVLQERCVGCKSCMVACPYGAMDVTTVPAPGKSVLKSQASKALALKCDLCIDHPGGPACIPSCPTKCLHLVDQARLEAAMKKRREQAALDVPPLPF